MMILGVVRGIDLIYTLTLRACLEVGQSWTLNSLGRPLVFERVWLTDADGPAYDFGHRPREICLAGIRF